MQAKQTKLPHFNSVQLLFCQKLKRKLWIKLPWFCMNNLSFIFNLNQRLLNLQGVKGGLWHNSQDCVAANFFDKAYLLPVARGAAETCGSSTGLPHRQQTVKHYYDPFPISHSEPTNGSYLHHCLLSLTVGKPREALKSPQQDSPDSRTLQDPALQAIFKIISKPKENTPLLWNILSRRTSNDIWIIYDSC